MRLPRATFLLGLGILLTIGLSSVQAHPIPKGNHDRTITVRLAADGVVVHYLLEVDEWTIIFQDLPSFKERVDTRRLTEPGEFYSAFLRTAGPLLAENLRATLDDHSLSFACTKQKYQVTDNVLFDFEFRAPCSIPAEELHRFTFRENNYQDGPGLVRLNLTSDPRVRLLDKIEPDVGLQAFQMLQPNPEDAERLRTLTASIRLQDGQTPPPSAPDEGMDSNDTANGSTVELTGNAKLVRVFLTWKHGFALLLLMFAALGALHALTPGHGKTLVAAYLVGERGTVWHALLLGLTTTLTHTGAVLVLALVLMLFFPRGMSSDQQQNLQRSLELIGGLLVAGLGFWQLRRRLAGQADHVHLGGGHHHHHGPHHHDRAAVSTGWGLIILGISGGIVPCWDAVALLAWCVSANLLSQALPLLLSFSAGLAGVLILIGILVVRTKSLAGSRWEHGRLFQALPLISAVIVTGLGLWLCYGSLSANP